MFDAQGQPEPFPSQFFANNAVAVSAVVRLRPTAYSRFQPFRSGAARVEFDARLFESDPDRQI